MDALQLCCSSSNMEKKVFFKCTIFIFAAVICSNHLNLWSCLCFLYYKKEFVFVGLLGSNLSCSFLCCAKIGQQTIIYV